MPLSISWCLLDVVLRRSPPCSKRRCRQQARVAGIDTPEMVKAQEMLTQEDAKEHLLEELRTGAAFGEMGDAPPLQSNRAQNGV